MTKWILRSKRKKTSGLINRNKKKKRRDRGRDFLPANVGEDKVKVKRESYLVFHHGTLIGVDDHITKKQLGHGIEIKNPDLLWIDKYGMWKTRAQVGYMHDWEFVSRWASESWAASKKLTMYYYNTAGQDIDFIANA